MGYEVKDSFLSTEDRKTIKTFLDNSPYWGGFESYGIEESSTDRQAFTFTHTKNTLPKELQSFKTDKHNVYQFVIIKTTNGGAISEHIDDDFSSYFINNNPEAMIGLPETTVCYIDVDNKMEGGEFIVEGKNIKPKNNMAIILEPGTKHSVTSVKKTSTPRLVVVCEKYFILSKYIKLVETPNYRKG